MLVGFDMPAVQSVGLTGGTWLTADAGMAMFDGKPARRSRLARNGAPAVDITLAEAVVPGIIAVLGLDLPPGTMVSAAGASARTTRLPDGSVCAWLFPDATAAVSTVTVAFDTSAATLEIGEIAIFRAVDIGIADGWTTTMVDTSVHTRTKGAQVNTVAGRCYRRFTADLAARPTSVARDGALSGTDWETVLCALQGRRRGAVVPEYRQAKNGVLDPVLAARSAIYGMAVDSWSIQNVSGRYFSGQLEFEEIPG